MLRCLVCNKEVKYARQHFMRNHSDITDDFSIFKEKYFVDTSGGDPEIAGADDNSALTPLSTDKFSDDIADLYTVRCHFCGKIVLKVSIQGHCLKQHKSRPIFKPDKSCYHR